MELDKSKYQEYFAKKHNTDPSNIEIYDIGITSNGKVNVKYRNLSDVKMQRTRRITGYLSNIDNWNNAKRAEEKDRIKHI
jgi:anaerobic ribonucleoside-triphosphate reductase